MKKDNINHFVTFLRDYVSETPDAVIESWVDGEVSHTLSVPGTRHVYQAGQTIDFGGVKRARAFVKAVGSDVAKVGV